MATTNDSLPEGRGGADSKSQHQQKMKAKRFQRDLEGQILVLKSQHAAGCHWPSILDRPDLPTELLNREVSFIYAVAYYHHGERKGAQKSATWKSASLPLGALYSLCEWRDDEGLKDDCGIAFMTTTSGSARQKDNASSWTAAAFDDDNHAALGRTVLERQGGPLRCCFGTANDGKRDGSFPVTAYRDWQLKTDATSLVTAPDGEVEQFLNHDKEGHPHRQVKLLRTPGGFPKTTHIDGEYCALFEMAPQERSRSILVFAEPIDGDLLQEIISRGLVRQVCEEIERDVFGVVAHDEKTKTVNAVAYLPSGGLAEHHFKVCGEPRLYDAVSAARRVLDANSPRVKPVRARSAHVPGVGGGLRGLLLATLIEEQFTELMSGTKTSPLVLRRCPFADGHGTRRGQADGSAFVYDADTEAHDYPYIGCQHQSCSGYTTKDFVNEMIRDGDLPADIYQNQDYRIELE